MDAPTMRIENTINTSRKAIPGWGPISRSGACQGPQMRPTKMLERKLVLVSSSLGSRYPRHPISSHKGANGRLNASPINGPDGEWRGGDCLPNARATSNVEKE